MGQGFQNLTTGTRYQEGGNHDDGDRAPCCREIAQKVDSAPVSVLCRLIILHRCHSEWKTSVASLRECALPRRRCGRWERSTDATSYVKYCTQPVDPWSQ